MGSTVKTFQSSVFQSDTFSTSFIIPNSFQSGVFQGDVFQSGISYKKIIDEVVSIIMPFGYQSNIFDPNAFQTAIEAVKQIVKIALVNETVVIQSFLGNTQALARVIDENLGITEA